MSDNPEPDNVVKLGGGGLLYKDARDQEARHRAAMALGVRVDELPEDTLLPEDLMPDPPPWADAPEPVAPRSSVVAVKAPPPQPRDWRELISTLLELAGIGVLTAGGWLIAPYVGLIIAGIALVALGVATSNNIRG